MMKDGLSTKKDYKKYRLAGCPDGDKRLLDVWKLDTGYDPDYNYYDVSTGEGTYEIPVSVRLNYIDRSYYISAVKQESRWKDRESRANLQIEEGEYLNLTYLNSVWVQYAIQNRKVGGWKIANATMNYAQSLPYLKIALDYLREREEKEAEMLSRYMRPLSGLAGEPIRVEDGEPVPQAYGNQGKSVC